MRRIEIKGMDANSITLDLAETLALNGYSIECEDGKAVRLIRED